MSRLHCHAQIEYTALGKQYGFGEVVENQVETLTGFDPRVAKDREFIHLLLDEYLDYLSTRVNNPKLKHWACEEKKSPSLTHKGKKRLD
jgi:hypothetical protein